MIRVKRAYDPADPGDGARFLVDRLWPRGVKKEVLDIEAWIKEIAPSNDLRKWYHHDPAKWQEFRDRYFAQLEEKAEALAPIREAAQRGDVTLVYSAKNTERNNAVALKEYLER
jgi:uncharacterized protein YeaO (DUF488 family)